MASLQLVLLGGFQACSPIEGVITLPVKKAQALLAYLALHPGQRHLRDKLAALLWEDSSEAQARHSLRQVLVCLRKAFPETAQVIQAHDNHLTLPPEAVDVDVLEFERLTNVGTPEALEPAIALYQGELLEGFNPGSSRFEDWLMERRSQLRERAIAAAETLLIRQLTGNPGERAIALALRLLSWDPLRESAQRTLMELYHRLGRPGAALKQYRVCRAVLQRELGVEPEPQTEALYQQLLQQRRTAGIDPPLPVHRPPEADAPHESLAVRVEPLPLSPPPLEGRALAGGTQRRQVSILAARLAEDEGGESLDLEERHAAQQDLLTRVQTSSERLGGSLIPSAPDTVMVIFGVPQAHGNDAERAVRAALAIQQGEAGDAALGHRRPVCIGLASGLVVASPWRTADPPDYRVTGDAVQEADRWCAQAGPAEIVIADALYASLQEWVVGEALGETGVPPAWRLQALREEPRFEQSAFIGRRESLRPFAGALESCGETGCGQALLVRGDAGIGKTRLIEEYATLARARGFACHRALILDFGVATGQDPLQTLVRALLNLHTRAPVDQVRAVVARTIADGIIEHTQDIFLNDLLGLPQPTDRQSEYEALRHEARQQGQQTVIDQLIAAAAARQPWLLVVEDIHWADAATLEVLARIAAVTR